MKNNPVPADKSRWGAFSELAERNWDLLREILQDRSNATSPLRSPKRQVSDFFVSAMDTNRIEGLGFQPLAADLRLIEQLDSRQTLFGLLGEFHSRGIGGMCSAFCDPDPKNSSIYAYFMWQGGLSLPDRDYYLSTNFAGILVQYREHVTKMFVLLGERPDEARLHAATVVELETALAKGSRTRVELRDPEKNYNKFSRAELEGLIQGSRFYLSGSGFSVVSAGSPTNAPAPAFVIVGQPEFFRGLDKLIQERSLADWKTYLRWQLVRGSAPHLHRAAEEESFAFFGQVLRGQQAQEPRWKRSGITIDRGIGEALGQLYVERYFPPEAKSRMNELVENLREVFRDRLRKVDWMSEPTRAKGLAKFERFVQKIGAPEKFRDYSSVEIRADDYLGNVRRATAFEIRRQKVRVGQPVDRTEWLMTPSTVNAYFEPSLNEIVFPAGILQPPFFDFTLDDAVNYGAIGAVIGHEITHGFDDEGRKYDADGNLNNWWTEADAKVFEARAQKVVDEYDAFEPLPGLHVNGRLTLGENIADLGGATIAYEALQRALGKDPAKRRLIDGLTPEQRFFISFAQIWRSNTREAEQRRLITVDPHAPGAFRATGPLLNMPSFFDAFGIRAGDRMFRPESERAVIW